MEIISGVMIGTQFIFTVVTGLYFYNNLKSQNGSRNLINKNSKTELERIKKLRNIKLSRPLSEQTRPDNFDDIIGQEKGVRAIKAALCGANPQHIIIYGPSGVGKTAAARIIMEYAKKTENTPFKETAPFIEMDSTILQFDERSIADPLIGSVHDPIYQGAGSYGQCGIPQPKEGAVTKAHGGVLFLDEIGELHSVQMNKLLKVLEDGKVFLNSSYYNKGDENIPPHIHDIFEKGFPADFRLIGATTRKPEEIPPALRSRCTEIFFRSLNPSEVKIIAKKSFAKTKTVCEEEAVNLISKYAINGRDTVNIVGTACSIAALSKRRTITIADVEDVLEYGRYSPSIQNKVVDTKKKGVVNGLAILGGGKGITIEIEALVAPVNYGNSGKNEKGKFVITGIIEEEELEGNGTKMKKTGAAKSSADNVKTYIEKSTGLSLSSYDIHINFPGSIPIDGPSAGIAMYTVLYSAIMNVEISTKIAMTGEISIHGNINPVGGVLSKIEGAIEAGIETVYIPKANYQKSFDKMPINVISVETVEELLDLIFHKSKSSYNNTFHTNVATKEIACATGEN